MHSIVFGVDLGHNRDWTVVCGLDERCHVCVLERWQLDWRQSRRRILDLIKDTPTLVSSDGAGDPIIEDLNRSHGDLQGFKFTTPSKQNLMEILAFFIQCKKLGFPDGWLSNELESFEYVYTGDWVYYSAPEGFYDDSVYALSLAVKHLRYITKSIKMDINYECA